ncbi:MAG: tetratricopeptide repeat protein [Deltaproteobacteria bacterium]
METSSFLLGKLSLSLALVGLAVALAVVLSWFWSRWQRLDRSATVYLKGLRYLLSGDPDGAIALLTKIAPSGTPEAYFTLGSLFRRKGEIERAIQLHKNLLLAGTLDDGRRREALLELGRDYREAQLWDEAANVLEQACAPGGEASEEGGLLRPPREELREVYLAQGKFEEAARCQRELGVVGADLLGAHLWAEACQAYLTRGDPAEAERAANEALAAAPSSAHARWARAATRAARADLVGAREDALAAALTAPELGGLLWPWLGAVHVGSEAREELLSALAGMPAVAASSRDARLLRAQLLRATGRQPEAIAELRSLLSQAPGFLEARRELGRLLLESDLELELRGEYEQLLHALATDRPPERCLHCGQPARELLWRCPACRAWDWLPPIQDLPAPTAR